MPYNIPRMKSIQRLHQIQVHDEMPSSFVVVDLETTGLNPRLDKIVEIAILTVENGEVVDVFDTLVNPGIMIPFAASRVNNITDDMVRGEPTLESLIAKIHTLLDGKIVTGYNVTFDIGFLDQAFYDVGLIVDQMPFFDVLDLVRRKIPYGRTPNHRLETMKHFFGIQLVSHRAGDDCRITVEVLKKVL